jgi:hypothetical protein
MTVPRERERSRSELVFGLLRTLMIGYQLWGAGSGLELADLPGTLRTSGPRLVSALRYLSREGWVRIDEVTGTVRLTDSGARRLLGQLEV